jgi:hypothetical protein
VPALQVEPQGMREFFLLSQSFQYPSRTLDAQFVADLLPLMAVDNGPLLIHFDGNLDPVGAYIRFQGLVFFRR